MVDEEETQPVIEASVRNLDQPEVLAWLAALVALSLKKTGTVTFFVDDIGRIQLANPLGVYLDLNKMNAPNREFRFVRPVLMGGKPQYVAFREDGSFWEIEFEEPT